MHTFIADSALWLSFIDQNSQKFYLAIYLIDILKCFYCLLSTLFVIVFYLFYCFFKIYFIGFIIPILYNFYFSCALVSIGFTVNIRLTISLSVTCQALWIALACMKGAIQIKFDLNVWQARQRSAQLE